MTKPKKAGAILGTIAAYKRWGLDIRPVGISDEQKHMAAVKIGRLGGLKGGSKGGLSRANNMTATARSSSASYAAKVRWNNERKSIGL